MKKLLVCLTSLLVCFMLAFTACGGDAPSTDNGGGNGGGEQNEPVYELTLSESSLTLELTHSAVLTATLTLDGKVVDGEVSWSSDNESVASVTGGKITALTEGNAKITASANGKTAECAVTVNASYAPKLDIGVGDASRLSVVLGGEYKLVPYIIYDGARFDDGRFDFSTSDERIVSVSDDGTLSGVDTGNVFVTVTGSWRGFGSSMLSEIYSVSVSRDFSVRIDTPSVTTIASSATVPEGYDVPNSVQLTASVIKEGVADTDTELVWSSSDDTVATVEEDGLVVGKAPGKVNITVSYTDEEGATYTAIPVTITVEFPRIDMTESIDLGEVDASDAFDTSATGLIVSKEKVFGANGPAVTEVYEVRDGELVEFATTTAQNGDGVIRMSGSISMTSREQVWEVRNAHYGYRVKVFVITRVIHDATDLMACFNIVTTGSNNQVFYGAGAYYVLGGNIDASGTKRTEDYWTNDLRPNGSGFQGEFDGKGYTIDGLTVGNGGLFGNLTTGAVIKNFALTSLTLETTRADYQPAPIAYSVYGDAQIENVFIQITSAGNTPAAQDHARGVRGFAHLMRGYNTSTHPTLKNVVISMDVGDSPAALRAASLVTNYQSGNFGTFENVHVISDYKFVGTSFGDSPNPALSGTVTRYGKDATNASFAAAFADSEDVLASAGLDSKYWVYDANIGYPMFKSYAEEYLAKAVGSAIQALPATLTIDAGNSWKMPSACGTVTLTGSATSGVTLSNAGIETSATAVDGTFTVTVTSAIDTTASKNITVTVRSKDTVEQQALIAVYDKLNGKNYEFNVGAGGTWDISKANISEVATADFGNVILEISGASLDGVTLADNVITIADTAQPGTVTVIVKNSKFTSISATITVQVMFKTTVVNTLTELSKDSADNKTMLDYSTVEEVGDITGIKLSYRADGATDWTEAASGVTFAAGKATLTQDLVNALAKTGKYQFRVQASDAIVEFSNVMVYTDIITTPEELLKAFLNGKETAITYGEGTYYVLGGDIEATGYTQVVGHYSAGGFKGTFDGKGYSINGLTVQSGGLFGHLASGAVVKNFALTNTVIGGAKWQPTVLATNVYTNVTIENLFIHIAKVESTAKATNNVRAFANLFYGDNNAAANMPQISNIVIVDASDTQINSFAEKINSGNDANFINVHVIADAKLLGTTDTNEYFSGVTRYGSGANYASFKAAFASAQDVLASANLDKDYWTYDTTIGYPVFTSYYDNFLGVVNEFVEVSATVELSQDADDNMCVIDYTKEEGIASEAGVSASYRVKGAANFIAIAEEGVSFEAGKLTLSDSFLASLTVAGENKYEFSVRTETKTIRFTNVSVFTSIITTAEELKSVFSVRVNASSGMTTNGTKFYGAGAYYVLGNNITVDGELRGEDNWCNDNSKSDYGGLGNGFQGTFDGRGYTIDKLTVHNGGMFGNLAAGAVVKNFALTNVTINTARNDYQPSAIAYFVYGNARIENVFVHITNDVSANAYGNGGARGLVNNFIILDGNSPVVKNTVVYMDLSKSENDSAESHAGSLASTYNQDCASFENVHIVSNYKLLNNQGTANDNSTVAYVGTITRYGAGAGYATFADAHSTLSSAGLDANCWTYDEQIGYPIFATSQSYLANTTDGE